MSLFDLETPNDVESRYKLIWKYYKIYFKEICIIINEYHKKSYSEKYWKIVIGWWLSKHITFLIELISQYKNLNIRKDKTFLPLYKTFYYEDFFYNDKKKEAAKNLIFILCKNFYLDKNNEYSININTNANSIYQKFKDLFLFGFNNRKKIFEYKKNIRNRKYAISDHYKYLLPKKYSDKINNLTNKSDLVFKLTELSNAPTLFKYNMRARRILFIKNNHYEDIIDYVFWYSLIYMFPTFYLENYKYIKYLVAIIYPNLKLKKITLSCDLNEDLFLNFYVATQIEKNGAELVEVQHGGGYGIYKLMFIERVSKFINDKFYYWGKLHENTAIFHKNLNIKKNIPNTLKILYTTAYIYPEKERIALATPAVNPNIYLNWMSEFLERILKYNIKIHWRPYERVKNNNSYSQKITSRLKENLLNNLTISDKKNFYTDLSDTSLFVCDHIGTTILETISANIPTVIFYDKDWNEPRDDVKFVFDELYYAKILHYSPKSASDFIKRIYSDINLWWESEETQNTRKLFVDNLCGEAKGFKYICKDYYKIITGVK